MCWVRPATAPVSVHRIAADGGASSDSGPLQASRRSIALPDSRVQALRKHRAPQHAERLCLGPVWDDNDFMFTNRKDGPKHVNSPVAQFARQTRESRVPKIRFHDVRHTSATLLLAEGMHPNIVRERFSHDDISMTLNRYSHVTSSMQRQAADTIDIAIADAMQRVGEIERGKFVGVGEKQAQACGY